MVAGPQYGVARFSGMSGMTYSKAIYCSDVNGALINWDGGAGASSTSPDDWLAPELMFLADLALAADLTDCKQLQICRNGIPTGDILRTTIHLVSVTFRPQQRILFAPGNKVTIIQKT